MERLEGGLEKLKSTAAQVNLHVHAILANSPFYISNLYFRVQTDFSITVL